MGAGRLHPRGVTNGSEKSLEAHAEREPKAKRLFGFNDLFDDGPFIECLPMVASVMRENS
jgi:hypothetical protein